MTLAAPAHFLDKGKESFPLMYIRITGLDYVDRGLMYRGKHHKES